MIAQARAELAAGDLLQASEKAWGATAHAIKSVAQLRGWEHYAHPLLNAAAWRISREHNRPNIRTLMYVANEMHQNFYEHRLGEEEIEDNISEVEELLNLLEQVKTETPVPFTPRGRRDRERLAMLDGALDLMGRPRRRGQVCSGSPKYADDEVLS